MSTTPSFLTVELLSDTSFSSGEATPGVVDLEVAHDDWGLPVIGGKVLHGLLRDAWLQMRTCFPELGPAAGRVLGHDRELEEGAILRVGDARAEPGTHQWVAKALGRNSHPLRPEQVLEASTTVRTQTARSRRTGAPERTTLRSTRVVVRGLRLHAPLTIQQARVDDLQCLALCVLATRHGGLARSRGRGLLRCLLDGDLSLTRQLAGLRSEAR